MPRVVSPQAGRPLRRVLILAALAAAGPALAQAPGSPAGSPASPGPAARRTIAPTGRTMPPPRGVAPNAASTPAQPKAPNEAAMLKAQQANEARSKAWDSKMHKTMGTICNGC